MDTKRAKAAEIYRQFDVEPTPICDTCLSAFIDGQKELVIDRDDRLRKKRFDECDIKHHQTLSQLQLAAGGGCRICSIFLWTQDLWPHDWSNTYDRFEGFAVRIGYRKNGFRPNLKISLCQLQHVPGSRPTAVRRFHTIRAKDYLSRLKYTPISSDNTSSEPSLQLARSWLRDCKSHHTRCQSHSSGSFIPTRLLDLGIDSSFGPVRLCERNEIPPESLYTTLSHCWGEVRFSRLTNDNLNQYKKNMPLDEVPKTFTDAFDVSRRLGVRYIWIDALCIIQDSPEDWARESLTMRDVFEHSHCNIAATSGQDGAAGCYSTRDPNALNPHPIPISCPNLNLDGLYYFLSRPEWDMGLEKAPLLRRAWVFQEILLAPRVLHFEKHQLVWECNEGVAREQCPTVEVPNRTETTSNKPTLSSMLILRDTTKSLLAWYSILERYTSCQLTFETDRLVAMSGVALKFANIFKGGYYAGLWVESFEYDLLWMIMGKGGVRSETSVAPSWSWASMKGGSDRLQIYHIRLLSPGYAEYHSLCIKVLSLSNFIPDLASFGRVSKEMMTLNVRCYLLGLLHDRSWEFGLLKRPATGLVHEKCGAKQWRWFDEKVIGVPTRFLWFMPVIFQQDGEDSVLAGLILQFSEEDLCFRRVGCMKFDGLTDQVREGFRHSHDILSDIRKNGSARREIMDCGPRETEESGMEFKICEDEHIHDIGIA